MAPPPPTDPTTDRTFDSHPEPTAEPRPACDPDARTEAPGARAPRVPADGIVLPGPLRAGRAPRPAPHAGRLVVVSNRLPFVLERGRRPTFSRTVGGLATGVEAFLRAEGASTPAREAVWIGWPGRSVPASARARVAAEAAERYGAAPVFLGDAEARRFYEGFCNRTLWPLFHGFPASVALDDAEWEAYGEVNERFRDAVLEVVRPGDTVWVHDYPLLRLPGLLRAAAPDLPIAFFLHVPFPPHDVLRVLPESWVRALLEGVLASDVLGLHTYDYARHVLRAAQRVLGLDHRRGDLELPGRIVRVEAFPMGIDYARYASAGRDPAVAAVTDRMRAAIGARRAILSIDRLDYTKGILHRVHAFERFLETRPACRERVVLVAVVVPSRTGIDSYRRMRVQLEEAVGRVNGRFGHVAWTPILYQYRALPFEELTGLYRACDVALVTPLRDGMNLVAKEYVAARGDDAGVLVLSETAGAARELGEALLVAPYHVAGLADAIEQALDMPPDERARRSASMRRRLERYDVVRWGREQLAALDGVRAVTARYRARLLPAEVRAAQVARWRGASRRLVLLDYDGTLVPFARAPAGASPTPRVVDLLRRLASSPRTLVVLTSGRDARTLDAWFGALPIALVAEHGARERDREGAWSASLVETATWKPEIHDLLQVFADRLPGSVVEEKESSLAWHYRGADEDLGPVRARELVEALEGVKSSRGLRVVTGHRVVEVRPERATKGDAALRWIARERPDFVVAAGDDTTDEDLFVAVPADAWTIRVGLGASHARYNVEDPSALLDVLESLARPAST